MSSEKPGAGNVKPPDARRGYEKPAMEFVELHGDQVLSGFCKTAVSGGTGANPCSSTGCLESGSS